MGHYSFRFFLLGFILSLLTFEVRAVTVQVIDAYADVRTGPGRGYKIFHSIEQGESIQLRNWRPGWYEIQTETNQTGWASARDIARTIQATGEPADIPSIGYGDFLTKTWWTGFSSGYFASGIYDDADALSIQGGYRFLSWLTLGMEYGRLYRSNTSGNYYGGILQVEPYAQWKVSPQLKLGLGRLDTVSQPKQGENTIRDSDYHFVSLGMAYYVGRKFLIESEVKQYFFKLDNEINNAVVETDKNASVLQIGFKTFF